VDWFFQASGLNEDYMVVDFTLIKERTRNITDRFDHVTILNDADAAGTLPSWMRVVTMPNSPTAENMARFFYTEYFRRHEADKCALLKVRVWETEDSYAEYTEAE
jgi:6-pyruvoyl-tetrahydropterin synthase